MTERVESIAAEAAARPSFRRRLLRRCRQAARIAALIYLLLALLLDVFQNRLIYPGHATQGMADTRLEPSSDFGLLHLATADGTPIVAVCAPSIDRSPDSPTILFFYGNAMCAADSLNELDRFRRLGCNVIIPDYAGYGMSGGAPSEAALYATADAVYDYAAAHGDSRRIIAAGWSLGGAVAIDLASRRRVDGLMTFSAFTSMTDMARLTAPIFPTPLFLRSRFDNLDKIGSVRCPMLLVHGSHDSLVPPSMHDRLTAAAKATNLNVRSLVVDTDHADIFDSGGAAIDAAAKAFCAR